MIGRIRTTASRGLACGLLGLFGALLAAPEAWAGQAGETGGSGGAGTRLAAPRQTGAGQQPLRIWSYGARGVLSLLNDDSLDPGFGATGFAVYPFTTDLEVEIEAGLQFMNTEADGVPKGRLTSLPVRGTLRLQLWRFGGAMPYAGGGAGIYFHRFSLDSGVEEGLNQQGFGASASVDTGFGVHAAGGIEWQRGRWHIGADVKYVFGETDTQSAIVDQVTANVSRGTGKLSLDGFFLAVGARIQLP